MSVIPLEHVHSVLVSSAGFSYTVTQPASVAITPGVAASDFTYTGGVGGTTSIATTGVGGTGTDYTITTGAGGVASAAVTASTGGRGGNYTVTLGAGGAANNAANIGTNLGGKGGTGTFIAGNGGAAANGSDTGGAGGDWAFTAGNGGNGDTGGVGGNIVLTAGNVGTGGSPAVGKIGLVANGSAAVAVYVQNNAVAGYSSLELINSAGVSSASLGWANASAALFAGSAYFNTQSAVSLVLATNNASRVVVSGTGVLSAGIAGDTNPALQVDPTAASAATGLKITAAAAAGGVALAAISSGTNEAISIASKGAAALTLLTNSLTRFTVASTGAITIAAPTSGVGLTVSGGGFSVTAGNIGIGIAAAVGAGITIQGATLTTDVSQYGVLSNATFSSAATTAGYGVFARVNTAAAAYTMVTAAAVFASNAVLGAASAITSAYGVYVQSQTRGGTNNYGVYVEAPSGGSGSNIGLYNAGTTTLANTLTVSGGGASITGGLTVVTSGVAITAGNLAVNGAINANRAIYGTLSVGPATGTGVYGSYLAITRNSVGSASNTSVYTGTLEVNAVAATVVDSRFLYVTDVTLTAGTLTTQYGIYVDPQTKGGTNNYGIYVGTPSGGSTLNRAIYVAGGGIDIAAGGLLVAGTQVVGAQGLAVADAAGGSTVDTEARAAVNALLARLRTHGLIAT